MPLVSIVIVNWNGAEVLPECLESLLRLNHKDFEIVVVDNGSVDDSVDIVGRICGDRARVVRLEKNIGFAAGVNVGFENSAGEFIATLNNDMIVEPSWLDQPLEFLRDESVGIVCGRQMNYYDRSRVDGLYHCIVKELVLMPFGAGRELGTGDLYTKPGYVMGAHGGAAILRAKTVRALGGYDPEFFGYMEETDFCLRAFLRGWRCVYAPNAVAFHMDGFSFKKLGTYRNYLCERNRIWFLYKNIPAPDILKRLPRMLAVELRVIMVFLIKMKKPLLYLKARFDALRGLSRYRKIRRENTALFKTKRQEFYRFEKYKKLDMAD
jgi:GT2 family glycosyltransferase